MIANELLQPETVATWMLSRLILIHQRCDTDEEVGLLSKNSAYIVLSYRLKKRERRNSWYTHELRQSYIGPVHMLSHAVDTDVSALRHKWRRGTVQKFCLYVVVSYRLKMKRRHGRICKWSARVRCWSGAYAVTVDTHATSLPYKWPAGTGEKMVSICHSRLQIVKGTEMYCSPIVNKWSK